MTTDTITAPDSLTLAKTGTIGGKPAMVAFGDKKTILLVLNEAGGWDQTKEVAFSGIRGMGILTKDLDAGSARRADEKPVFAASEIQEAAPQEAAPTPAPVVAEAAPAAPAAPEKVKRAPKYRAASLLAAAQDLRLLAAARRRAKRPSPWVGVALDNAVALSTLAEYPTVYGGRLPCRTSDAEVLEVLQRHGLSDLNPEPTSPLRRS